MLECKPEIHEQILNPTPAITNPHFVIPTYVRSSQTQVCFFFGGGSYNKVYSMLVSILWSPHSGYYPVSPASYPPMYSPPSTILSCPHGKTFLASTMALGESRTPIHRNMIFRRMLSCDRRRKDTDGRAMVQHHLPWETRVRQIMVPFW